MEAWYGSVNHVLCVTSVFILIQITLRTAWTRKYAFFMVPTEQTRSFSGAQLAHAYEVSGESVNHWRS